MLLVAVIVHEIDAPVQDCGAGIAVPHINRPQLVRLPGLPGAGETHRFRADAITAWPAKLRPCARKIRRLAIGSDELAGEHGVGVPPSRSPGPGLSRARAVPAVFPPRA